MNNFKNLEVAINKIYIGNPIDKDEVLRLQSWYEKNKKNQNSNQVKLMSSIDKILQLDEINKNDIELFIDEAESFQFKIIRKLKREDELEMQLKKIYRKIDLKQNFGIDLVNIIENEKAVSIIHERAENNINKAMRSYSNFCSDKKIIFISLSLIALLEYDGNFYANTRRVYKTAYEKYSKQNIENFLRNVLNGFKTDASIVNSRAINVSLKNAIVPAKYLPDFFDYICDIYKYRFHMRMPDDIYSKYKIIFDSLRNDHRLNNEILFSKITKKQYKLIASTRQLIEEDDGIKSLIELSIRITKIIDNKHCNKSIVITNPYLKVGFDGWIEKINQTEEQKKTNRKLSNSKWKPKFVISNGKIYLYSPKHKVHSEYDYTKIAIVVENSGIELYRNDLCDIREGVDCYEIFPNKIEIKMPIGKLSYKVMCGEKILYDSKDKLYREYIVFDSEGKEIRSNTNYSGVIFICSKSNNNYNIVHEDEYYITSMLDVKQGETINLKNTFLNFRKKEKAFLVGEKAEHCYVTTFSGKKMQVYKTISQLIFEVEKYTTEIEIRINEYIYKIDELKYQKVQIDGFIKYTVNIDSLPDIIYSMEIIQVNENKRNKIASINFALDKRLDFRLEENDDIYKVILYSNLTEKNRMVYMINGNFDLNLIKFSHNNKVYYYNLPLEIGCYRLDNREWHYIKDELWIGDIAVDTKLSLYDIYCDDMFVYNDKGELIEEKLKLKDCGTYKEVNLGFLKNYKNKNEYVNLAFVAKDKVKHVLLCRNKCLMNQRLTQIIYEGCSKSISVLPIYSGKNKVYFEVYKNNIQVAKSRSLTSGQCEKIENIVPFEDYVFKFYEKTNGLQLVKKNLLLEKKQSFYTYRDFVGRVLKIDSLTYSDFENLDIERHMHLKDTYIKVDKMLSNKCFEGTVFLNSANNNKFWLNRINPVIIEINSEENSKHMKAYITSQGDGVLVDFNKKTILNSINDFYAPDIINITINLEGANL